MRTLTDWRLTLSASAAALLARSHVSSPPVDAIRIARALGLTVALDHTQSGRGRIKRIAGKVAIFLRPDERPERLQWAAAHELGESLTPAVCRALGVDGGELAPRQREEIANQLAREILLPDDWFRRDCRNVDFDLTRLKARYHTASHELIAWRWLDLETPAIVTIFDQGALTRRRSNLPVRPPPLTELERCCWNQLRQSRQSALVEDPRLTVRGWCVDSPGWEREILLTRPGAEEEL